MSYREGLADTAGRLTGVAFAATLAMTVVAGCKRDNPKPPYSWPPAGESQLTPEQRQAMQEARDALLLTVDADSAYAYVEPTQESSIEELPGYGVQVTPEHRELINKATVQLASSYEEPSSPNGIAWALWCTATKVSLNGQIYLLTAGHCISGSPLGYRVVDPNIPVEDRLKSEPVAQVEKIARDYGPTDFALLKLGVTSEAFNKLPALDINDMLNGNTNRPLPGQEVAINSMPGSAESAVRQTGIYLGRVDNGYLYSGTSQTVDLVAISPQGIRDDGCYYGASGSSFVSGTFVSGPLAARANIGYPDGSDDSEVDPLNTIHSFLAMMGAYGIDTNLLDPKIVTVCGYTVPEEDTLLRLAQMLEDPDAPSVEIPNKGGL